MDRIIIIEKGNIVENGVDVELLVRDGHFAELWNSQVNGFIPEN